MLKAAQRDPVRCQSVDGCRAGTSNVYISRTSWLPIAIKLGIARPNRQSRDVLKWTKAERPARAGTLHCSRQLNHAQTQSEHVKNVQVPVEDEMTQLSLYACTPSTHAAAPWSRRTCSSKS